MSTLAVMILFSASFGTFGPQTQEPKASGAKARSTQQDPAATEHKGHVAPKLTVGSDAPALHVKKWLRGRPVQRFQSDRVHVIHFFNSDAKAGRKHFATFAYLQAVYGEHVTFIGMTWPAFDPDPELTARRLEECADKFKFSVGWDGAKLVAGDYLTAAGIGQAPCSFVIDGSRRIAFIGHPGLVDGVLGDVLAKKWDPALGTQRAEMANRLISEFNHDRSDDWEEKLASIDEFCELNGFDDAFREPRFTALTALGRNDDAARLAKPLFEFACATDSFELLNGIAWLHASPENQLETRDMALATRAAKLAVELTDGKNGYCIDTLAHCQWRNGEFESALQNFERAIPLVSAEERGPIEVSLEKCRVERDARKAK